MLKAGIRKSKRKPYLPLPIKSFNQRRLLCSKVVMQRTLDVILTTANSANFQSAHGGGRRGEGDEDTDTRNRAV